MDKRLVRVTWVDAADPSPPEGTAWYSDEDVDRFSEQEVKVVSVGWVKSDTKQYLTLVADYIEDGDTMTWGRPTKVPKGMIQTIEDLQESPTPN